MYDDSNYNPAIGMDEDAIEPYGLIQNNSATCFAINIELGVTIQSMKNSTIKQENNFFIFGVTVAPQTTYQYQTSFDAFDTFVNKQTEYGMIARSALSSDAKITTKVVSAQWALLHPATPAS